MQHIVDRNQEVLNNFIKAIEELAILRDNLFKKEVCLARRLVGSLRKIDSTLFKSRSSLVQ